MRELSLNVLDVVQNSISAGATLIEIEMKENKGENTLVICIKDNGKGMDDETVRQVIDPFYTSRKTRKVGLGIPFFKMASEQTGGRFEIYSEPLVGTKVCALFKTDSIDFTPVGDMCQTIEILVNLNPSLDFVYIHKIDKNQFCFDTRELREALLEVPLNDMDVIMWIRSHLEEQTRLINGG